VGQSTTFFESKREHARLASLAAPGEVIVSEATLAAAGLDPEGLEERQLELKGKSEAIDVRVIDLMPG
jgi:class 3 adenylate cyclase